MRLNIKPFVAFFYFWLPSSLALYGQQIVPQETLVQCQLKTTTNELKTLLPSQASVTKLMTEPCIFLIQNLDFKQVSTALNGQETVLYLTENCSVNTYHQIPNQTKFTPNDPLFNLKQWNVKDIGADSLWDITLGEKNISQKPITVAVIDNGFFMNLPDMTTAFFENKAEISNNGLDDDGNGYTDDVKGWNVLTNTGSLPEEVHGTSVSSVIAAAINNKIGLAGLAPKTRVLPVSLGNDNNITDASVFAALEYIRAMRQLFDQSNGQKGAYVVAINHSFGRAGRPQDFPLWCNAYKTLGKMGILSILAVPNSLSIDLDITNDLPCHCNDSSMIVVSSIDQFDKRRAALGRTKVHLMAPGEDIPVASSGGTYSQSGGTSIAAPHVTAAVALMHSLPITKLDTLAQKRPETLAQLIKTSLIEGVKKIDRFESVCRSSGKLNLMSAYYTMLKKLGYTNFNSIIENIYPNPISINTPITIEIKSKTLGQQFDLRWYDAAGRLLMATPISANTVGSFKISTAPPTLFSGLYFLKAYEPQTGNSQVKSIFVD